MALVNGVPGRVAAAAIFQVSLRRFLVKLVSMSSETIYMDYNGTTPVAPEVREKIARVLEHAWGNPSSSHSAGKAARTVLDKARAEVASVINASPDEVVFTSGGTESNNLVLLGIAPSIQGKRHLVTSRIEHPSVMNPAIHLMEKGWDVSFVGVDSMGVVDVDELERAVRSDTALVSVMLANNETGVIQPLEEICRIAHRQGVPVHADAAQAIGKMPVDVKALGVDYLTVAGHKLYAPKGIGALFVKEGAPFGNLMFGAGQERGMRPGTEPVPLSAGLGAACSLVSQDLDEQISRLERLREMLFERLLLASGGSLVRHGDADNVLCNTLFVSFPGIIGNELLERCPGLMASTGAACHDRKVAVSHVLSAMNVEREIALGTVRFTIGRYTTEEELRRVSDMVKDALQRMDR